MHNISKAHPLLPLVEHFITKSRTGKRLQPNGDRISTGTIQNYTYLQKHLAAFQQLQIETGQDPIRIKSVSLLNTKAITSEKNYWKRFYNSFLDYLYSTGCYDNYVGSLMKHLRCIFHYIEEELLIPVGPFYKSFYVPKEEVPIITLSPERLHFLIGNEGLSQSLSKEQRMIKDILVFGCTVALRFGDLRAIRNSDIQVISEKSYLVVRAQKTGTVTRVLLPCYALDVIKRQSKQGRQTIFPPVSLDCFNKGVQRLCERVGWTEEIGRERSRRGQRKTLLHPSRNKPYRFCDSASSHLMRRTAITTMLMNGVPELVVKKISGHSSDSKAFYRYVDLVQQYLDDSVECHFEKMMSMSRVEPVIPVSA